MFDPEGSTGHLCVCPFLGAWHALLCGEIFEWAPDGTRGWMERFFGKLMTRTLSSGRGTNELFMPYCDRPLFFPEVRLIRGVVRSDRTWFWELGG